MNKAFEKKAIEAISNLFFVIGLSKLLLVRQTSKKLVLLYHNPNPRIFSEHIKFLKKHFGFASLHGLLTGKEEGIAITFDDAYQKISDDIFPLLKKYQIPAVIFVPTGYCGRLYLLEALKIALQKTKKTQFVIDGFGTMQLQSYDDTVNAWHALVTWMEPWDSKKRDEKIVEIIHVLEVDSAALSAALVSTGKSLSKMCHLVELGSHTVMHPNLATLEEKALLGELTSSKKRVGQISHRNCIFFAYPFGKKHNISPPVVRAVAGAGYHFAFTAIHSFNERIDPFNVGRIGIGDNDSVALLCLKLSAFWKMLRLLSIAK